ncbi:hypothetical protein RB597_003831 [Gaeumannomyces tritici]
MPSLLTVNNNVSLLTVNIAPSTFLASLILALVFLSFYLPTLAFRLPGLLFRSKKATLEPPPTANVVGYTRARKPLPAVPAIGPIDLLQDLPLVLADRTALVLHDIHPDDQREHQHRRRQRPRSSTSDFEQPSSPPSHGTATSEAADVESLMTDSVSNGGFSPPAWRRLGNGDRSSGFWRTPDAGSGGGGGGGGGGDAHTLTGRRLMSPISRGLSPALDLDDDLDLGQHDGIDGNETELLEQAIRTRLPMGSMSPEKGRSPDRDFANHTNTTATKVEEQLQQRSLHGRAAGPHSSNLRPQEETPDNYIRFAVRAEVQQKTAPIENALSFFRARYAAATGSWLRTLLSVTAALISFGLMRSLFTPAEPRPVPDLVKVAGIARAFEPLIYYSENGAQQVGDLQATGVAVWDLGESVRSSNMTSAPIIVKELDDLSDSLKTLAVELTKFFANVDGDVDGILIVMDWARRELTQLNQKPTQALISSAFDNIHNLLSNVGVLENSAGEPTKMGSVVTSVMGMSGPQRTRATIQRTFNEFLGVLEEAIASELQHSLALFALFEAVDRQFLNLARAVARESNAQDEEHADLLSSLWARLLGPDAGRVRKYERNAVLLRNVRDKTVRNKGVLVEHNQRLLALKASLEALRRKLVSPLVRSVNSSTLSLEEQIRGLEDAGGYLDAVRVRQKGKLMEILYGGGGGAEAGRRTIEDEARAGPR